MPNWSEVLKEIAEIEKHPLPEGQTSAVDVVRRKYLKQLSEHTNRNVICYYSGWLQKPDLRDVAVNDKDVSGFMLAIHKLKREKGLDLILHTPGGNLAATESLVTYLKKMFVHDIRAIVPQLSMSAGAMIALSCKEIIMGKHSSLGPIDPQINGMPCQAVIDEFDTAKKEIIANPDVAYLWEYIITKYHPTFLSSCQNAIMLSNQMAREWLKENMCAGDSKKVTKILRHFSSHSKSKTHERHISIDTCKELGLNIVDLEKDQDFQDLVLTVHHCFMLTFSKTNALKIIENQDGVAYIEGIPIQQGIKLPIMLPNQGR